MIITTATLTEAQPIIDALNLKLIQKKPFLIFENFQNTLIVTKIGPINAAGALSHILTKKRDVILNMGICGGKKKGEIFNIYKAIDTLSDKSYILKKSSALKNEVLKTYAKPISYKIDTLVDMEGASLAQTAKLYRCEITILKVVSDNFEPKSINYKEAQEIIQKNLKPILDTISSKKRE